MKQILVFCLMFNCFIFNELLNKIYFEMVKRKIISFSRNNRGSSNLLKISSLKFKVCKFIYLRIFYEQIYFEYHFYMLYKKKTNLRTSMRKNRKYLENFLLYDFYKKFGFTGILERCNFYLKIAQKDQFLLMVAMLDLITHSITIFP